MGERYAVILFGLKPGAMEKTSELNQAFLSILGFNLGLGGPPPSHQHLELGRRAAFRQREPKTALSELPVAHIPGKIAAGAANSSPTKTTHEVASTSLVDQEVSPTRQLAVEWCQDGLNLLTGSQPLMGGPCYFKFLVPNSLAGALIGRDGSSMGEIEVASDCKLRISGPKVLFPGTTDRMCIVAGKTGEALEIAAMKVIDRMVMTQSRVPSSQRRLVFRLVVPKSAASAIIGWNGETVQRIAKEKYCRINVSCRVPEFQERVVTIFGEKNYLCEGLRQVIRRMQGAPHLQHMHFEYKQELPFGVWYWSPENREPENPNSPLMPYEVAQTKSKRELIEYLVWNLRAGENVGIIQSLGKHDGPVSLQPGVLTPGLVKGGEPVPGEPPPTDGAELSDEEDFDEIEVVIVQGSDRAEEDSDEEEEPFEEVVSQSSDAAEENSLPHSTAEEPLPSETSLRSTPPNIPGKPLPGDGAELSDEDVDEIEVFIVQGSDEAEDSDEEEEPCEEDARGWTHAMEPRYYTAAISACTKKRSWFEALKLLEAMPQRRVQDGPRVNTISFNATISATEKANQWPWALHLFQQMPQKQVLQDTRSFNATISSCEKGAEWQRALHLFEDENSRSRNWRSVPRGFPVASEDMPSYLLGVDVWSFNATISACEKGQQWHWALELFDSLCQTPSVQPDTITFNASISACEKAAQWQHALGFFMLMSGQAAPNEITYNATISALEKAAQWQKALQVFNAMEASPGLITYHALMSACEKASQWQVALELFARASCATRWVLTARSFNSVLSACEKARQWLVALQFFHQMPQAQVSPDAISLSAVVSACARREGGTWRRALQLFEEALAGARWCGEVDAIAWSVRRFHTADPPLHTLQMPGHWRQALEFFHRMAQRQIRQDVISFSAAISSCEKASQWPFALLLFQQMHLAEIVPNNYSYSAAIISCQKGEQWQYALELFGSLKAAKLQPDLASFQATLRALKRGSHWQQASVLLDAHAWQAEFCEAVGAPEVEQKRPMLLRTLGFKFEGFPQFFEVCRVVVLEGESCMTNHSGVASTVQLSPWPSGAAEDVLRGVAGPGRPASLKQKVWAKLPSGLILPENQDDPMRLIYEMEYLAFVRLPTASMLARVDGVALLPLQRARQNAQASVPRWWSSPESLRLCATALKEENFAVLDGFLPEEVCQALAEGAKRSRPSMVRGATGAAARVSPGQDLAKAGPLAFEGLPGGCPMWEVFPRKQMLCKSELMCVRHRLSCVDWANSAMFAIYPGGASRYIKHVDNTLGTDGRRLTAVLYLNRDWCEQDGGCLRIFEPTMQSCQVKRDIEPLWNRLVVFWSTQEVPHEVLSSYKDHVWFIDGAESLRSREPFERLFSPKLRCLGDRRQCLLKAAKNEDERAVLAALPLEATHGFSEAERRRLARLFGWRTEEATRRTRMLLGHGSHGCPKVASFTEMTLPQLLQELNDHAKDLRNIDDRLTTTQAMVPKNLAKSMGSEGAAGQGIRFV
eukprot:g25569.t1